MTPPAPRCPGGKQFPHARAAKRYAFENEPDKTRRPVHVQCDGHYHLAPRDAAPDQPRRTDGDGQQQRS